MKYKSLLALFICVVTFSVQAEQRWFEVELLLFQRNVEIKDINEHLSSQEITVNTEQSIKLLSPVSAPDCVDEINCLHEKNPVVITEDLFNVEDENLIYLDSSHLQLQEQRTKLEEHQAFQPVLHMAWRMPVESGRTSKPLHLFAGKNLTLEKINSVDTQVEEISSINNIEPLIDPIQLPTSDAIATEIVSTPEDKWEIEGNFNVYVDHYLFIDTQLIIRKEISETIKQVEQPIELIESDNDVQIASPSEAIIVTELEQKIVLKEILLDQNRRLRSEEIHFLDHPLIGIIVQIRKIPETEETDELQAESVELIGPAS